MDIKKALESGINSSLVLSSYPMVEKIIVTHFDEDRSYMDLKIYLNDPTINNQNFYEKEFDPHWLTDHYIKNILPYFGVNKRGFGFNFIVFSSKDEPIYYYKDPYIT